jgi:hypothetical protein
MPIIFHPQKDERKYSIKIPGRKCLKDDLYHIHGNIQFSLYVIYFSRLMKHLKIYFMTNQQATGIPSFKDC